MNPDPSTFVPRDQRVSRELILEAQQKPLDLQAIFENDHPIEFEIGIGKGLFLMSSATARSDCNFIGIEIARKYLRKAMDRIEKRPLPNVRLIHGEAFQFLDEYVPPTTFSAIHVYFPDPWPKKRHHKRRLFSPAFMALVDKTLIPGGRLLIATDHADYWEWIRDVLQQQTYLEPCTSLPETPEGAQGLTNYEIKYVEEGRTIYRTGYQKPLAKD